MSSSAPAVAIISSGIRALSVQMTEMTPNIDSGLGLGLKGVWNQIVWVSNGQNQDFKYFQITFEMLLSFQLKVINLF